MLLLQSGASMDRSRFSVQASRGRRVNIGLALNVWKGDQNDTVDMALNASLQEVRKPLRVGFG
jgi:hypothetical protein